MVTSIKQWHELLNQDLVALPPDSNARTINLTKSDINDSKKEYLDTPLSPITTFMLNSWVYCLKNKKNLIVNFPGNTLKPIPLLAYLSSRITQKSTLVFSSGNINLRDDLIARHNRNYYLLSWYGSDYLFRDIPICKSYRYGLDTQVYLPRASRHYKQQHLNSLKRSMISTRRPKIILNDSSNLTKVNKTVENIFLEGVKLVGGNRLKLKFGCIIFENADRYINSEAKAKSFVEWLGDNLDYTLGKDALLLFHFSNSNLKFLPYFKEAIDSLLIPFNQNILKNNYGLFKPSIDYFENKSATSLKTLNKYNCDEKRVYDFNLDIEIVNPLLEKGNLDVFLYTANKLLNAIDSDTIKNKGFYYRTINLLYSLNNLAINPMSLKFKTNIDFNNWRYLSVNQFIGLFASRLDRENSQNRYLLKKLLSTLYNFYLELSNCKRFGVERSYERIGKDYKLLEIIHNKEKYFGNNKKLIVGTYFNTEVNVLKGFLDEEIEDVEVIYMAKLFNSYRDFTECNLLLPGIVPPNYFSILKMPFKKVLILSYDGFNSSILRHQIDLVLEPSIEDEKISMNYFYELYNFLGETTNNVFFNDFNKRYEEYERNKVEDEPSETIVETGEEVDDGEKRGLTIKEIFDFRDNYAKYVEGRKRVDSYLVDVTNKTSTPTHSTNEYTNESVSVDLINVSDGLEYTKFLLKNKKYLRFKSYDKLDEALEVKPDLFNKNDYIVVLDDNRSFLDLYLDIFDEDEYIDRDFVDYWKDILSSYIESHDLNLREFYDVYKSYCDEKELHAMGYQTVRNWARGYIIAPKDPEDLKKLAIILNDTYILENYEDMHIEARKLRGLNMRMGRKLSSLIKDVILNTDSIDYGRLSFEERIIYNKIKNSIYQVV